MGKEYKFKIHTYPRVFSDMFPAALHSSKPASEKAQASFFVYETSLGGRRAQSGQTANCTATFAWDGNAVMFSAELLAMNQRHLRAVRSQEHRLS